MESTEMTTRNPTAQTLDFSPERLEHEITSRLPTDAQANGEPTLVLIMGPICAGKTTLRKDKFAEGFVLVDAAQLFIEIGGIDFDFPSDLELPMEFIGSEIARRAVAGRMNIVTEIVGSAIEPVYELIESMKAVGYLVDANFVNADLEACLERNTSRSEDNVSAYYTEPYQMKWLLAAAKKPLN